MFEKSLYLTCFLGPFINPFFAVFAKQLISVYAFLCDSVIALMKSVLPICSRTKIREGQKLIFWQNDDSGIFEKERALAKNDKCSIRRIKMFDFQYE